MAVVGFNNLNIGVIAHHFRRFLQQLKHNVHADAKVRGENDSNLLRGITNSLFTRVIKAGGANHHSFTVLAAKRQMRQRAFRAGKIDENIKIIFHRFKATLYGNARFPGSR